MDLDSEPELKLSLLIYQLITIYDTTAPNSEFISVTRGIYSLINSMDLDSQPKPELESELINVIKQIISLVSSIPDDEPESELKSLLTELICLISSMDSDQDPKKEQVPELMLLITQVLFYLPYLASGGSELGSHINRLCSLVVPKKSEAKLEHQTCMDSDLEPESKLISLLSQFLDMKSGSELISHIHQVISLVISMDLDSQPKPESRLMTLATQTISFVKSMDLDSQPKPLTEFISLIISRTSTLFGMELLLIDDILGSRAGAGAHVTHPSNSLPRHLHGFKVAEAYFRVPSSRACVEKPPLLSIDHPKWHEHTLSHFPRQASLTCDLCALTDSNSHFYLCLLCDFVVHQSCLCLPHVIRISRHPHRISFTPSFGQGNWVCGVCRREINNDYGGYSCIKDGCSYAAHSKCATQSNVWDGKELEGEPAEIEEEVKPSFVRISDGIIQHFSHEHHHLRLDENADRDFDENKQCEACITPIYFGNYYSCMQCEFILHETCANLSRKMHHPIHPHLLTLVTGYDRVIKISPHTRIYESSCSACPWLWTAGFFYECGEEGCQFKCATIPQKVRYKHDKHMLVLSYGKETSTMTYWCEACEGKINPKKGFYKCDEYCCVTLHIDCLNGKDLYMKPGASWLYYDKKVGVLPNNQHMSRPFCYYCICDLIA
ncbi:unnamed protein product [Microthlaspi erraticum]|uniref:DC1 domain-containing protein n=1 Tax=Microthlaspi erraticum TaxID=1685480 RepID=A0A6D2KMM9_9BRAS|nr:unnamed protein product [Microthlaspi erraticum]